jgi:hypothetical protein
MPLDHANAAKQVTRARPEAGKSLLPSLSPDDWRNAGWTAGESGAAWQSAARLGWGAV